MRKANRALEEWDYVDARYHGIYQRRHVRRLAALQLLCMYAEKIIIINKKYTRKTINNSKYTASIKCMYEGKTMTHMKKKGGTTMTMYMYKKKRKYKRGKI